MAPGDMKTIKWERGALTEGLDSNFRLCGQSWLPEEMPFEPKTGTYIESFCCAP